MIRGKASDYGKKFSGTPLWAPKIADGFAQGAFWACEEILSAASLVWGFSKRDGEYLEVLREIINKIEGHANVPK